MSQQNPLSLSIARNTLINLTAQIIPPIVAVVALPFIVRGLGIEEFGVLSIIWIILSYSGFLELGLGRALTKFVAEYIEQREEQKIAQAVWTTLTFQSFLGVVVGLVLIAVTPLLVRGLGIPPALAGEARLSFYLIAILPPLIFGTGSLGGLLMAGLRFDLFNAVQVLSSVLNYTLIAVGAYVFHLRLSLIVAITVAIRALTFLATLALSLAIFPTLRRYTRFTFEAVRPFFAFGGWVAVTSTVGQIITRVDRFIISSLMSISWVTYYSVPYDALSRLWIFPASLVTTLFPTFSGMMTMRESNKKTVEQIYMRSVKYLLIAMVPVIIFLIIFAGDILRLWMGSEFAEKGTRTFQILSVGMLLSSLSWVPFTLLQSMGRPDLPAKFICVESVAHFLLAWALIKHIGIEGAALAWTIRSALDVVLHFGSLSWLGVVPISVLFESRFLRALTIISILTGGMLLLSLLGGALLTRVGWAVALNALFAIATWRYALDQLDKRPVSLALSKFFPLKRASGC
jgi:O-antigen/teichoic acid export membrane protein